MAKPIEATDIRPGAFITAFRWIKGGDHSYVGSVLKVIAVDLPFVVVEEIASRYGIGIHRDCDRLSLDTREIEFGEVSQSYIAAMTERQKETVAAGDDIDIEDL